MPPTTVSLDTTLSTLPTVIALRLCGRFGTGSQCHVNKLPVELISAIEPFIFEPARAEILETWSSELRCFELKCDIVDDHFTPEGKHKLYHHATSEVCFGESDCVFGRGIDAKTAAKHRDTLVENVMETTFWIDSHDTKTRSWVQNVDTERPNGIFNEYRENLRNHFGIDIWTSNVRLPPLSNPPAVE